MCGPRRLPIPETTPFKGQEGMKHKLNSLSRHQVILSQIHETEFSEKVRQIERKTPKM